MVFITLPGFIDDEVDANPRATPGTERYAWIIQRGQRCNPDDEMDLAVYRTSELR